MSETQVTERTSLASRVRAGVALLDREEPGWFKRVDLARLNVGSCSMCVLGQLFGAYASGVAELDLYFTVWDLGFDAIDWTDAEYDALTRLWAYVVRTRQAVAQ